MRTMIFMKTQNRRLGLKVLSSLMAGAFLLNTLFTGTGVAGVFSAPAEETAQGQESGQTPDAVMGAMGNEWYETTVDESATESAEPAQLESLETDTHYANGQIKRSGVLGNWLTGAVDPWGGAAFYEDFYREDGKIDRRDWHYNYTDVYEYNSDGSLRQIVRGGNTLVEYDETGREVYHANRDGSAVRQNEDGGYTEYTVTDGFKVFDAKGALVRHTGPSGDWAYTYHENGQLKTRDNLLWGARESYAYDEDGRLRYQYAAGVEKRFESDGSYWTGDAYGNRQRYSNSAISGQRDIYGGDILLEEFLIGGMHRTYWDWNLTKTQDGTNRSVVRLEDDGGMFREYDSNGSLIYSLNKWTGTQSRYMMIQLSGMSFAERVLESEDYGNGSWMRHVYHNPYGQIDNTRPNRTEYSDGRVREYGDHGLAGVEYRDIEPNGNWTDASDYRGAIRSFDAKSGDMTYYSSWGSIDRIEHADGSKSEFVRPADWGPAYRVHTATDGTVTEYHPDSNVARKIKRLDGRVQEFTIAGKLLRVTQPDGSSVEFYDSGVKKTEVIKDAAAGASETIEYRADGTRITSNKDFDWGAEIVNYSSEGKPAIRTVYQYHPSMPQAKLLGNAIIMNITEYRQDGSVIRERDFAAGTTAGYYPSGIKKFEGGADGSMTAYAEDGTKLLRLLADGSTEDGRGLFDSLETGKSILRFMDISEKSISLLDGPWIEIREGRVTASSAAYLKALMQSASEITDETEANRVEPAWNLTGSDRIDGNDMVFLDALLARAVEGGVAAVDAVIAEDAALGGQLMAAELARVTERMAQIQAQKLEEFGADGFNGYGYDAEGYGRDGYHKDTGLNRNGYDLAGNRRLYHPNGALKLSYDQATGVTREMRDNGSLLREADSKGTERTFFESGRMNRHFDGPSRESVVYFDLPGSVVASRHHADGSEEYFNSDGRMTRQVLAHADAMGAVAYQYDLFGRAWLTELANAESVVSTFIYADTSDRSQIDPKELGRLVREEVYADGVKVKTMHYVSSFSKTTPPQYNYQYVRRIDLIDPATGAVSTLDCHTSDCMEESMGILNGWGEADDAMAHVTMIEVGSAYQSGLSAHLTAVAGVFEAMINPETGISTSDPLTTSDLSGGALTQVAGGSVSVIGGMTYSSMLAAAIEQAVKNGTSVISLSLEIEYDEYIQKAVEYAQKQGVVVVAAAGNDDPATYGLANAKDVVAVGAVDYLHRRPAFSNQGSVDLVASGVNVLSYSGLGVMKNFSGTSFAAPMVAATIGKMIGYFNMLKAGYSNITRDMLSHSVIMKLLADSSQDLGEEGEDRFFGNGLIRPMHAMAALKSWFTGIVASLV